MAYSNPNGVANTLADVPVYIKDLMDEVVASATLTADLSADPRLARQVAGKKKVEIMSVTTDAPGNYSTHQGYPTGKATAEWVEYTPEYDRAKQFVLDAVDASSVELTATTVMSEFVRQYIVPEMDSIRLMRAASAAVTAGNTATVTPATASFLGQIVDAIDAVRDGAKREDGTVVYVNRKYKGMLSKSTEVTKSRDIAGGSTSIKTGITDIDEAKVVYVPASYMRTAFTASDNGLTAGGKEVPFIAVAPGCVHGYTVHQAPKIIAPEVAQDVDGWIIDYRVMFDALVLENKVGGVYAPTIGSA